MNKLGSALMLAAVLFAAAPSKAEVTQTQNSVTHVQNGNLEQYLFKDALCEYVNGRLRQYVKRGGQIYQFLPLEGSDPESLHSRSKEYAENTEEDAKTICKKIKERYNAKSGSYSDDVPVAYPEPPATPKAHPQPSQEPVFTPSPANAVTSPVVSHEPAAFAMPPEAQRPRQKDMIEKCGVKVIYYIDDSRDVVVDQGFGTIYFYDKPETKLRTLDSLTVFPIGGKAYTITMWEDYGTSAKAMSDVAEKEYALGHNHRSKPIRYNHDFFEVIDTFERCSKDADDSQVQAEGGY